jgi:DNA (cytosine-5)-methyltransferase 1
MADQANFAQFESAIAHWEKIIGRRAPDPLLPGGQLSPMFVEWMMGLPPGHVTDSGLSRTRQLKVLGNGVVPLQAALALAILGSVFA